MRKPFLNKGKVNEPKMSQELLDDLSPQKGKRFFW
jgi:hypothetical protein